MEHFGDVGSLDDNVESFLSQDDGDGRDLFGTLKPNPSEHATDASKGNLMFLCVHKFLSYTLTRFWLSISGFSFSEVGSIRKSNSKVVCCHFSSDGKLLASAGHDKKVEWISFFYVTVLKEISDFPNSYKYISEEIKYLLVVSEDCAQKFPHLYTAY